MKFSSISFLIFTLLLFACKEKQQYHLPTAIAAGQKDGDGIYYHDLQPDDSIIFTESPFDSIVRLIDINTDGTNDFILHANNFPDPDYGSCSVSLESLNQNEILCTIAYQSAYLDTLGQLENIDRSSYWLKETGLMFYEGWDTEHNLTYSIGFWNTACQEYAGVLVIDGNDTLYGWISIEHNLEGIHALIIKDFACTGRYLD
jgi:hypothetical protein